MTNHRLIAIGDIHGCAAALADLLRQIAPGPADTIVTLGDYVDRGPDTRGVIEQLIQLRTSCRLVPLLGNHDQVLLDLLAGVTDTQTFLQMGGQPTLDSYGPGTMPQDIPAAHVHFLRTCEPWYETDSTIFVHANYDPHRPLDQTSEPLRLWAPLEPPYPAPHYSGKRVVVGHTPQRSGRVLDLGHAMCIDTGCCYAGVLTAIDTQRGRLWTARQPAMAAPQE